MIVFCIPAEECQIIIYYVGKRGFENMADMDLTNIVGPILTGSFEVSQLEWSESATLNKVELSKRVSDM